MTLKKLSVIYEHLDNVKKDTNLPENIHSIFIPSDEKSVQHCALCVQHQDVSVHVFLTHSLSIKCPHAVNEN